MPDSYMLTGRFIQLLEDTIARVHALETTGGILDSRDTEDGMYVRLVAAGNINHQLTGGFDSPAPYTAERVIYNEANLLWVPTEPAMTFNPDEPSSWSNTSLYVYDTSGTTGLVGQVHWITLSSFEGGEAFYWGFSVNGDHQFARITSNVAVGSTNYNAEQLDKDLVPTGVLYGGVNNMPAIIALNGAKNIVAGTYVVVLKSRENFYFLDQESEDIIAELTSEYAPGIYTGNQLNGDLVAAGLIFDGNPTPMLKELSGREKLGGERVLVHVVTDAAGDKQYTFRWDDPILEMGDDQISPPVDANGSFLSFFDDAGVTLGIDRNFDPVDGVYKFNQLIAIGVGGSVSESTTGVAAGLAISQLADHTYQIQMVDNAGNYIPSTPSEPTTDIDNIINIYNTNPGPYCSKLFWNNATRQLKIETRDANGVLVPGCTNTVTIPCCDNNGDGDVNDIPTVVVPPTVYPPTIPTDNPTDDPHSDECQPPIVSCCELGAGYELCLPISGGTQVARVCVDLNGAATDSYSLTLTSVTGPLGAVGASAFALSSMGYLSFSGESISLAEAAGVYSFVVTVANVSNETVCDWSDYTIECQFRIKDCECDEDDTTTGGDVSTDNCPVECSDIELEAVGDLCVVNGGSLENDTGREATFTVTGTLLYGAKPKPQALGYSGPTEWVYTRSVTINFSKTVDADRGRNGIETLAVSLTEASTNYGSTRPLTGKLRWSYTANAPDPRKTFHAEFRDSRVGVGGTFGITDARTGRPGVLIAQHESVSSGTLTSTLAISDPETEENGHAPGITVGEVRIVDPCENDEWEFAISGLDSAKFGLAFAQDTSVHIYQRTGVNFMLANYDITITATRDDPSPACVKTLNLTIPMCSPFNASQEEVATRLAGAPGTAVTAGRRGDTVTTLTALNGAARIVRPPGVIDTAWRIISQSIVDDPSVKLAEGGSIFSLLPMSDGEAELVVQQDLAPGTYTIEYSVSNAAMYLSDDPYEIFNTLAITVDKTTAKYERTILLTSSGEV